MRVFGGEGGFVELKSRFFCISEGDFDRFTQLMA
jgi:hypothetical protein